MEEIIDNFHGSFNNFSYLCGKVKQKGIHDDERKQENSIYPLAVHGMDNDGRSTTDCREYPHGVSGCSRDDSQDDAE